MIHLTEATYADVLKTAEHPICIKLSAVWCVPCKSYAKTFAKVAGEAEYEGVVTFAHADLDEAPGLFERFRVRSIPATLLVRGGKAKTKLIGAVPATELRKFLKGA